MIRIFLLLLTAVSVSLAWAEAAKRLSCEKTDTLSGNEQCIYEVVGQKINDPQEKTKLYAMSSMPYALCSSAICLIDKKNPGLAKCRCHVFGLSDGEASWRHASVGPYDFSESKEARKDDQTESVTSNFSFANYNHASEIKSRECKFKQARSWANCFGVRCRIVNNTNSNKTHADCNCPIVKTESFISMGPKTANQCTLPSGRVWSAATKDQGNNDFAVMQDMYQKYYPSAPVRQK